MLVYCISVLLAVAGLERQQSLEEGLSVGGTEPVRKKVA